MLVCLAVCHKDHAAACKLAAWIIELGGASKHQILCVLARDLNPGPLTDMLRTAFRNVAVMKLTDKEPPLNPHPEGLPHAAAANLMFRRAAKEIMAQGNKLMQRRAALKDRSAETRQRKAIIAHNVLNPKNAKAIPAPEKIEEPEPFLWLEPDAVPLHPDWLDVLEAVYRALPRGKRFMGALVNKPPAAPFMSGVAVYPWDAASVQSLVTCEHAAFDVNSAGEVLPQMFETKLIQHEWGASEEWSEELLRTRLVPGAVIFHQSKQGQLINVLRSVKALGPRLSGNHLRAPYEPEKVTAIRHVTLEGKDQHGEPKREHITLPPPAGQPHTTTKEFADALPPYKPEELEKSGEAWRANADYDIRAKVVETAKAVFTEPLESHERGGVLAARDLELRLAGTPPPFTQKTEMLLNALCIHLRVIHDAGDAERKAVMKCLKTQGLVSSSNGRRAKRKPMKRK